MKVTFPTDYPSILGRLKSIEPTMYGKTRNFIDGDVTYLSPYISRGVISTRQVLMFCLKEGYHFSQIEKFIQELVWRDYWQRVWQEKDVDIEIKHMQTKVLHEEFPESVLESKTSIEAIDEAITNLIKTGYMHNHMRMYIASIITNAGQAHWRLPAKWMYYHLLDGDWASNSLSWQWVCGANSDKKYFANQENINKFCYTNQAETFLDKSYDGLEKSAAPEILLRTRTIVLSTSLPDLTNVEADNDKGIALYTWYNMDPEWRKAEGLNKILILEPSHFEKYPISQKSLDFLLNLKENIEGVQVYVGEFNALKGKFPNAVFFFKEHPTNKHFTGVEDQRDWIGNVEGYYSSFFRYWKRVKKDINK